MEGGRAKLKTLWHTERTEQGEEGRGMTGNHSDMASSSSRWKQVDSLPRGSMHFHQHWRFNPPSCIFEGVHNGFGVMILLGEGEKLELQFYNPILLQAH